jgi:hypothetical protein
MSEFSLKKQRECAYTFRLVSVAVSTSAFHFDELSFSKHLDLSILRVGPDLGRVEKSLLFRAEKILPMNILMDASQFSGRAQT